MFELYLVLVLEVVDSHVYLVLVLKVVERDLGEVLLPPPVRLVLFPREKACLRFLSLFLFLYFFYHGRRKLACSLLFMLMKTPSISWSEKGVQSQVQDPLVLLWNHSVKVCEHKYENPKNKSFFDSVTPAMIPPLQKMESIRCQASSCKGPWLQ